MTLESEFHGRMVEIWRRARTEANYNATGYIQMVSDVGGLEAARRLVARDTPSDGFTTLWEKHRLDLTVEALVLEGQFDELFDDELRDTARRRLSDYGWSPPAGHPS
jgi:hypothetical protein